MTILLLLPVALSLLVFGAHLLRADAPVLLPVVVALLALLAVRRRWAARTLQAALLLAALEWLRALLALAGARMSMGLPYGRMAVILGTVAVVTALSAAVFKFASVRRWFRLDGTPPAS